MEDYKVRFIEYLLTTNALKGDGDFSLKSKRLSPWFVNIGDFNDWKGLTELGRFHGIVGRAITESDNVRHASLEYTSQL